MPAGKKLPKYCLHKATGQAFVWLDGKNHYLGSYDSPESKSRYRELVEAWQLRDDQTRPIELRIGELILLYLEHARGYYRKNGKPTSEIGWIESSCRFLMPHRRRRAADFGPLTLEAIRLDMVGSGLSRNGINARIARIRRMIRWAVSKQLVRPDVLVALEALAPLREGRTKAPETEPVGPVDDEHVDAVLPLLSEPLRAAVEVLRLTGARTGEILSMRVGDIEMGGETWEYRPRSHKTEHKGKRRIILLGPKAQEAIRPLLKADPDAYIFRPSDVKPKRTTGRRRVGARYNRHGLRTAIYRACKRVNKARQAEELPEIPLWHPHQLRHSAATRFKREFGVDVAQTALGHASLDTTEIYAERDLEKAKRMILAIG